MKCFGCKKEMTRGEMKSAEHYHCYILGKQALEPAVKDTRQVIRKLSDLRFNDNKCSNCL